MKVTQKMIETFGRAWHEMNRGRSSTDPLLPGDRRRAGLEAVLKDVPDVKPFTFSGYPDNEVYLHRCGTVVDVLPGPNDTRECIEAGECDCENTSPWMRVYVEKRA